MLVGHLYLCILLPNQLKHISRCPHPLSPPPPPQPPPQPPAEPTNEARQLNQVQVVSLYSPYGALMLILVVCRPTGWLVGRLVDLELWPNRKPQRRPISIRLFHLAASSRGFHSPIASDNFHLLRVAAAAAAACLRARGHTLAPRRARLQSAAINHIWSCDVVVLSTSAATALLLLEGWMFSSEFRCCCCCCRGESREMWSSLSVDVAGCCSRCCSSCSRSQ